MSKRVVTNRVPPNNVMGSLSKSILVDGFHLVVDLKKSKGSYMVDARTGKRYLDMYTYFSTLPIGHNHPKLQDKDFLRELNRAALENPANSDVYTEEYARFVSAFSKHAKPSHMKHLFFIAGGALAVEKQSDFPQLAKFAIRDMGKTVAAGIIIDLVKA